MRIAKKLLVTILTSALIFSNSVSVYAKGGDVVYQDKYTRNNSIVEDCIYETYRTITTYSGEDTSVYYEDFTTGIATMTVNGSLVNTYDINALREDIVEWTIPESDLELLESYINSSGNLEKEWNFEFHNNAELQNKLIGNYEINNNDDGFVIAPMKTKDLTRAAVAAEELRPYPTPDSSSGNLLDLSGSALGIMKESPYKDKAWEFIEGFILEESQKNNLMTTQFSVLKEELEKRLEEAELDPYEKDKEGNIVIDSDGNPIRRVYKRMHYMKTGLTTYQYPLLEEESKLLWNLIQEATSVTGNYETINTIVKEEATAYYSGQKTIDEVIVVIMNRIQLFAAENE